MWRGQAPTLAVRMLPSGRQDCAHIAQPQMSLFNRPLLQSGVCLRTLMLWRGMRVGRVNATRPAARRLFATPPFNTADEPVGVPMAVDATPSPGRGGARSPPALPASGSIPSTTENFRNVRPLQTAFTSNGLVSKRRRGVSENKLLDDSQLPSMSSSGTLRANTSLGSPPSGLPSRNSFGNALPLRDVVQAAQANVAFQSGHRRHPATMPDTPMKPSPSMADTSTKVRSHRRGTSMGGPFPSRAPLFGTCLLYTSPSPRDRG